MYKDITNERFGRLVALKRIPKKGQRTRWLCRCDCGKEKEILLGTLTSGRGRSCGCLRREITSKRFRKYDENKNKRLYEIWVNMRSRCNNPNDNSYKNYGGRGIEICTEWDEFLNFEKWSLENGYDELLTIDRINNDGGYSPDNCRWVDVKVQANNTRLNVRTKINGINRTLAQHAEKHNVNYFTLFYRYSNGLRDKDLIQPNRKRRIKVNLSGEVRNLKEWSRIKGINYGTLQHRYSRGLRGEELFKPVDEIMSERARKSNKERV